MRTFYSTVEIRATSSRPPMQKKAATPWIIGKEKSERKRAIPRESKPRNGLTYMRSGYWRAKEERARTRESWTRLKEGCLKLTSKRTWGMP